MAIIERRNPHPIPTLQQIEVWAAAADKDSIRYALHGRWRAVRYASTVAGAWLGPVRDTLREAQADARVKQATLGPDETIDIEQYDYLAHCIFANTLGRWVRRGIFGWDPEVTPRRARRRGAPHRRRALAA